MRPKLSLLALLFASAACSTSPTPERMPSLFVVDAGVDSRSVSFENPTGGTGQGGTAAHPQLGPGRKGSPNRTLQPRETITLCDLKGPGVIRHIWATVTNSKAALEGLVLNAYWDEQSHPSVDVPIANFMGLTWGVLEPYESFVHSVNPNAGLNISIPMPFRKRARITLTNNGAEEASLYYSLNYTIGDELTDESGRLHALFRRECSTTPEQDFEILPRRNGKGRYLGTVLGIRPLTDGWWGEGEFKVYLDGDREWPTIVGTGTEDYNLQSFGIQDRKHWYAGTNLMRFGLFSIYRWHVPDPIYWNSDIRVTIQQIGYYPGPMENRSDDWSATTFWYEPIPSDPLPIAPSEGCRGPVAEEYIRDWAVKGPFRTFGMSQVDIWEAKFLDPDTSFGPLGSASGWEYISARYNSDLVGEDRPLGVDLLEQLYGPREKSVAYLGTYLWSGRTQSVRAEFFSSDGLQVFLGGQERFRSRTLHRSYMMESVDLPLRQGWNRLLVKLPQGPNGWSLTARLPSLGSAGLRNSLSPEAIPGE